MNRQIEVARELGEELDNLFWNIPESFIEFTHQICDLTNRINNFGLVNIHYNYQLWKHIDSIRQEVWEFYRIISRAKFGR